MIRFDQGQHRFNFRVVGIALHNHQVLLHRTPDEAFWSFPGGRAELGETTAHTLQREMREELAADIEIIRLLWIVENFFDYDERRYHELAFYFLMRLPDDSPYLDQAKSHAGQEAEPELIFQWFRNDAAVLAGLPLLPSFLQTGLQALPVTTQHLVHYDQ
jgi:8-oxo-dGTP pyrophosphatase MutT (NUDIX family)